MKIRQTITFIAVLSLLLGSCEEEKQAASELTEFQIETIQYFNEIALGLEYGGFSEVTRKWKQPMRIFVGGRVSDNNLDQLDAVVNEISNLVEDGFGLEVVSDSVNSNFYIHFGSREKYTALFPETNQIIQGANGMSYLYFNQRAELVGGHMLIDITRATETEQKHLIREELTQSLGLARHSSRYENSIFFGPGGSATSYEEIDRELVRLLYHPNMVVGVTEPGCTAILQNIYLEENSD